MAGAGAFFRRNLTADCVELRFWLRVAAEAKGDMFLAVLAAPRLDGGTDVGEGANVDVRLDWNGALRIGEQPSGGVGYRQLARTNLAFDQFHAIKLFVSTAGGKLEVTLRVNGAQVSLMPPTLVPSGSLHTLILGPSYATDNADMTVYYDDVSLR